MLRKTFTRKTLLKCLAALSLMAVLASPGSAQTSTDHPADLSVNEKLLRDYYHAYELKDWTIMARILADNFTFTSPAGDNHIDLAEYKRRCWPNCKFIKRFDLEEVVISGDVGFVTYNGWTNDDRLARNTERFRFKDGKVVENECFFGPGINYPTNPAAKK